MCFKGSRAFPSWSAVNEPFSKSGANFNATTTKQYTCFTVDCLNSYTHPFLRILGDMMLRSKFDKKEYELERNVVREEMKMKTNKSSIEELAFRGTAYANQVDDESYHKSGCLPYDDVVDFYHQYYVPHNVVVSVISSVTFDTIVRYVSATQFAEQLRRPLKVAPILNNHLGALEGNCDSNYMLKSGPGDTATIEIGVRVCDQFKPDEYHALNVLRKIVSDTMSSRLFKELREKRGLTYHSGAYMTLYEPAGVFVIYAVSDVDRLINDRKYSESKSKYKPGVISVMFDILDDLIKNGVTEKEMKMAKQNIRDSLKMESIAGGNKSAYNGVRVMLHNDTAENIIPNKEVFNKCYNHIKKSDVNEIIQKYFSGRKYYFAVKGGKLPKPVILREFLSPKY
jgi:predicted Zn-dependent peptidase